MGSITRVTLQQRCPGELQQELGAPGCCRGALAHRTPPEPGPRLGSAASCKAGPWAAAPEQRWEMSGKMRRLWPVFRAKPAQFGADRLAGLVLPSGIPSLPPGDPVRCPPQVFLSQTAPASLHPIVISHPEQCWGWGSAFPISPRASSPSLAPYKWAESHQQQFRKMVPVVFRGSSSLVGSLSRAV